MNISPKRVGIIYHNPLPPEKTRITILQHLRTLEYSEVKHDLVYYNAYEAFPNVQEIDHIPVSTPPEFFDTSFDAVILHYSFLSMRYLGLPFYKWKRKFDWIRDLNCLKIAIPQDEGDFVSLLDEWLFEMGVTVIFSVHYTPTGPLYPIMRDRANFYSCLPGYIDEMTTRRYEERLLPISERRKDIVYRARRLSYRYGRAGRLKYQVADVIGPYAKARGFNVDISTRPEDTILGSNWMDFIASGKTVIGSQGGYSGVDWRGELRATVNAMLRENPRLTFKEANRRMPPGWDDYRLFTVTPRHFEAVITKTAQVLTEGEYKGIFEPDKHYIPLKQDFSNLDDILEKLRDHQYLQDMVDCVYKDIYLSGQYTYRVFAKEIEQILVKHQQLEQEKGKIMQGYDSTDKVIAVLERQLIAERHQNAMLRAALPEYVVEQLPTQMKKSLLRSVRVRIKWLLPLMVGLALVTILMPMYRQWITILRTGSKAIRMPDNIGRKTHE